MAHEIKKTDKFAEVRSAGKRAWHGLGIEIPEGLSAEDAFTKVGLGWRTELAPVYATVDVLSENGIATKRLELPHQRAHVRMDTMEALGVVSDKYQKLENLDLARFADSLAGADAAINVETCGSLHDGRRIFACVKLPEVVRATADDVLEQYVLVSNGHGGFASFSCYPTSVRVVCANMLRWSERDAARGLSFIHLGGSMEERQKMARHALGIARAETAKFEEQVQALVRSNVSVANVRKMYLSIYDSCFGKIDGSATPETREKMEAKRAEVIELWVKNLDDERQKVKGIVGTKWAAYNAVSQWCDHERGFSEDSLVARVSSNLFGVSQKDKLTAFRRILATV